MRPGRYCRLRIVAPDQHDFNQLMLVNTVLSDSWQMMANDRHNLFQHLELNIFSFGRLSRLTNQPVVWSTPWHVPVLMLIASALAPNHSTSTVSLSVVRTQETNLPWLFIALLDVLRSNILVGDCKLHA